MILLIEGLNMTGKSTLAAAVAEALGLPILKFNVPPEAAHAHFRDRLLDQYRCSRHFVIDRAHLSNYAYNGQLGGGVLSDQEWHRFDGFVSMLDSRLFLMIDCDTKIHLRLQTRADKGDGAETLTLPQVADLQRRFVDSYITSRINMQSIHRLPDFIAADGKHTALFYQTVEELDQAIRKDP